MAWCYLSMDEIKDISSKLPTRYLQRFFAEKDIPHTVFTIRDSEGMAHLVPNTVVVERFTSMSSDNARKVEEILRKIDFHNGTSTIF